MNEKNEAWGKRDLSLREQNIPLKILVLEMGENSYDLYCVIS